MTGQPRPTTAFDLRFAAGALAIAAAALLLAGLFPNYLADPTRLADYPYVLWSSVITIALAAGAGAAVLAPPTRRLVGPGILLGAASAATWGLLTYLVVVVNILHGPVGPGLWIELLGETLLLFAGFLAGLALARGTDIRPGRLDGPIPLLVGLFGLAGAVAFLVYVGQSLAADTSYPLVVPGVWGAVLAFFVPAASVVLMPRRFGAALLGGWVAGASAIVVFDGLIPSGAPALAIVVAGAALLALLVAVIPLARQSRTP